MANDESDQERLEIERERLEIERQRAETDRLRAQIDQTRADIELARMKIERDRVTVEASRPSAESLPRFAEMSVRTLLILNGGAAAGLLTFASGALARGSPVNFKNAVLVFGVGALLSFCVAGLTYLSQSCYHAAVNGSERWNKAGHWLKGVAIICALAGGVAFIVGIYYGASALRERQCITPAGQSSPSIPPAP